MRHIDFQALLDQERVEYVTRGKNVKRGELNIRCPFCASADPSHHMGINLESGWWACWRNNKHRGKSPVRLLVALLGVPYWRAREMAGLDRDYVDPDGFSSVAARLRSAGWNPAEEPRALPRLTFPRSFRQLSWGVATRKHMDYLVERGFPESDVESLAYDYDLRGEATGDWAYRLILPYYMDGDLVTWTGRAIGRAELRYRDLSIEDSVVPPKHTLYNHDALLDGGRWLIVVEGPVDVLKLDFYGKPYGLRAVGLSTNSITEDQLHLLAAGFNNFEHLGAMMDAATSLGVVDSMRMRQNLAFIHGDAQMFKPPGGAKDAGAADPVDIMNFAKELT